MISKNDIANIWQIYKKVREGDLVIRSGFGLCGVYDYHTDNALNHRHPESDSEHANGCIEIARNLSRFCPNLFDINEWIRIFDLLRYHDLGEVAYGDHPDDGTQDIRDKNAVELAAFKQVVSYLPLDQAVILVQDFRDFQILGHGFIADAYQYKRISFCKLCDKLDAVLRAIIYELSGVGGDIKYKGEFHPPVSDRDTFYARCTGSQQISQTWALHFLDICHKYPFFALFFTILKAAVCEVNGGAFYNWLPRVQTIFDITDGELYRYPV